MHQYLYFIAANGTSHLEPMITQDTVRQLCNNPSFDSFDIISRCISYCHLRRLSYTRAQEIIQNWSYFSEAEKDIVR